MNKGIEVTRENFNDIGSRLERFFSHHSYVSWHQFRGGLKKRISRKTLLPTIGKFVDTTTEQGHVRLSRGMDLGTPCFYIHVDKSFGYFTIEVGSVILFLGNRIIVKTRDSFYSKHMYVCFQIGEIKDFDREGLAVI